MRLRHFYDIKTIKKSIIFILITLIIVLIVASFPFPVSVKEDRVDISTGLVSHYKLDEIMGTTATDYTETNNGTLTNGPAWTTGKINNALSFDGKNDRVDFNSNLGITGEMTISAWVYPTQAPAGSGRVVANTYYYGGGGATQRGWILGDDFGSNDNFDFRIHDSSGGSVWVVKNNFFSENLNKWTNVVGVFKPSTYARLYVNGSLVAEDTTSIPSGIAYREGTNFRIGSRADNTSQGLWKGAIDDVRVYNRALTSAEITEIYNYIGAPSSVFVRMLIKEGDPSWCYFKGISEPPIDTQNINWRNVDYSYPCRDGSKYPGASWKLGRSGFGYDTFGKRAYATTLDDMKGNYAGVYIRHEFDVLDPNKLDKLILSIEYDDSFVAYINGVEVVRRNISSDYTYPPYDTLSLKTIDPILEEININKNDLIKLNLTTGKNILAIQGHNRSIDKSSDFALSVNLRAETDSQLPILPADTWRYLKGSAVNGDVMSSDWKKVDFVDSEWTEGCSGFGYGDDDDCTVLSDMKNNYSSVYIRREFEIPNENNLEKIKSLALSINYDDGFVAYLNEIEVARRNMDNADNLFDATTTANGDREAVIKEVFDLTEYIGNLNVGKNVIAIQGHNKSKDSSDFSLIPALTIQPVTLVGAGDITGAPQKGAQTTRDILNNTVFKQADVFNAGILFTLGDNAYETGTYNQFTTYYDPNWGGKYKEITRPSVGNHEYFCTDYKTNYNCITNANGYFKYFNDSQTSGRAGDNGKGYYSYDHGFWHIIVLNTCLKALKENLGDCRDGNVGIDQEQMDWLKNDLNNNNAKDTLVYFHHPRYTNSKNASSIEGLEDLWVKLYNAGVDVVLNGHSHNYQRFAPKKPNENTGTRDDVYGIRQFIVGSGGYSLYELKPSTDKDYVQDMEASNAELYGVLKLTLTRGKYDWEFVTKDGIKDSGSSITHNPPTVKIIR